jgi:hypothetical protein
MSDTRRVVFETTRSRRVVEVSEASTGAEELASVWVKAALKEGRDSGKCVSFTVSVHDVDDGCDHETEKR